MLEGCSEEEGKAALLGHGRDRARRLLCPISDFSIRTRSRRIIDYHCGLQRDIWGHLCYDTQFNQMWLRMRGKGFFC